MAITAEALGFQSARASIGVLDDDSPNQVYDPSPMDGATHQPPRLSLRWKPGFGEVLENGDFELGDLRGWKTFSESPRGFVINDGNVNPDGPDFPMAPFEGEFGVVLAQDGPGVHTLSQEVNIPADAQSATLAWTHFIHNHGPEYSDTVQRYSVEIQDLEGELLETAFSTHPGDPLAVEWTRNTFDLTSYRGQKVQIVFYEQDVLGFINVGLDQVSVELGSTQASQFQVYLGTTPSLVASLATLALPFLK